jgi:hypothetical protein
MKLPATFLVYCKGREDCEAFVAVPVDRVRRSYETPGMQASKNFANLSTAHGTRRNSKKLLYEVPDSISY